MVKNSADFSVQKLKLIQNIKNDSENKLLKRIVIYGMRKAQINDIDFNQEELNFNDIIKTKNNRST